MNNLDRYEVELTAREVLAHANGVSVDKTTKMSLQYKHLTSAVDGFAFQQTAGYGASRNGSFFSKGTGDWYDFDTRSAQIRDFNRKFHHIVGDIPTTRDNKVSTVASANCHIPMHLPTDANFGTGDVSKRAFIGYVEHYGANTRQETLGSSSSSVLNYPTIEDSFVLLSGRKPTCVAVKNVSMFVACTGMFTSSNQLGSTSSFDSLDNYAIHGFSFRGYICQFSP